MCLLEWGGVVIYDLNEAIVWGFLFRVSIFNFQSSYV